VTRRIRHPSEQIDLANDGICDELTSLLIVIVVLDICTSLRFRGPGGERDRKGGAAPADSRPKGVLQIQNAFAIWRPVATIYSRAGVRSLAEFTTRCRVSAWRPI